MDIQEIKVYRDSQLIINQVGGVYKTLKPKLSDYHDYVMSLLERIPVVTLLKIPCGENVMADALAKLAKELACSEEDSIPFEVQGHQVLYPLDIESISKNHVLGEVASAEVQEMND